MQISHNVSALFTLNSLQRNNRTTSKSLERLSSGLRINRAADDAAGLAISEKMRGQIRGLDQAIRNVQDGISLIQTADSALGQIQDILQRMNELAVQAANGTLTNEDRLKIQAEIDQLKESINGIASNTRFNTIKLLDGTYSGASYLISPATNAKVIGSVNLSSGVTITAGVNDSLTFELDGVTKSITLNPGTYTATSLLSEINDKLNAINAGVSASYASGRLVLTSNTAGNHRIDNLSGNSLNSLFISNSNGRTTGVEADGIPTLNPSVTITAGVNDTLTFDIDTTSYTIVIPSGTYYVDATETPLNQNSPLLLAINSQLRSIHAPATVGFIYYVASPPEPNGTGLYFLVGTNGIDSLPDGIHTFGNFRGNAKSTLFDSFMIGWTPSDSSGTISGTVTNYAAQVTGNIDLSSGITIITGVNDTLNFEVDGVSKSITLNAGTYDATSLLNEINNKLAGVGANITASYSSGYLTLTHNTSGAGHNINIISGNAINSLLIKTETGSDAIYGTADSIYIQTGANPGDTLQINLPDARPNTLGIDSINLLTQTGATNAISVIQNAIQKVSSGRSNLGAYQNRLEHTIKKLKNSSENLTSAESRIRDTDMAKEIMAYTKQQILQQASIAVLAQATSNQQAVLALIK